MADELGAMQALQNAFEGLDPDARGRVLRWALDKYGAEVRMGGAAQGPQFSGPPSQSASDLPTYFNAASPHTSAEKALVVGAWFQEMQGLTDFESSVVNRELKNLGYQSTNITRDFDELIARRPRLVVQTRKSGNTRQARKLYRVTHEGMAEVSKMKRINSPS